jgi:single-strand DNA-binding protein
MTLNQILLIGRAGNDPEIRYTANGTAVTSFSLAVNNRRREKNGDWVEDTEWFRITVWERQAESVSQYLSKGRRVFVEGRLSTSQYTSRAGEARTSLEVRASNVRFLDSPNGDSATAGVETEIEIIHPEIVAEVRKSARQEEQKNAAEAEAEAEAEAFEILQKTRNLISKVDAAIAKAKKAAAAEESDNPLTQHPNEERQRKRVNPVQTSIEEAQGAWNVSKTPRHLGDENVKEWNR